MFGISTMNKNSSTIAIGMAIGILLALVMMLLIKSFSRENLVSNYNGKKVGNRANHLASSFQHFQDGSFGPNAVRKTMNRFNIPMSSDPYVNWCRLRSRLGGCEVISEDRYRARGGSCKDECAALGQPGG